MIQFELLSDNAQVLLRDSENTMIR